MRAIHNLAIFISFGLHATAEELKIFSCNTKYIELPEYSLDVATENGKTPKIQTFKVGDELRTIDTGDAKFSGIFQTASAYDRSQDPFFGPGFSYIIKDASGKHYAVYFEYEPGSKTFTGNRFAIGLLNDLESNGAVFVGSPHQGTSFDENILKALKALSERK